jgi:hypothetical protein
MVAGADCIDGMDLLRHGGMGPVVHRRARTVDTAEGRRPGRLEHS